MSSKRQELLIKAKAAHTQAVLLRQNAQNVHDEYVLLRRKIDPQIFALLRKADPLAVEFRRIYAEAREAYADDEKDRAAALKEEGYPIELECRRLNNEANELRKECDDVYKRYKELFRKADDFDKRAQKHKAEADKLRMTTVVGFSNTAMNNEEIEIFLDGFPQGIFKNIQSITYNDESPQNLVIGREFGRSSYDTRNNTTKIVIYRNPNKLFMQETIAHEIGHVIYRYFMDSGQRWKWGEWHQERYLRGEDFITPCARESIEDNFCECFVLFNIEPDEFSKFWGKEFTFIKEIYLLLPL